MNVKTNSLMIVVISLLLSASLLAQNQAAPQAPAVPVELTVPTGFKATVFASGIASGRLMAVAPDGTLYATRPYTGQVLALTDNDGDGLPDRRRRLDRTDRRDVVWVAAVRCERRQAPKVRRRQLHPPAIWQSIPEVIEVVGSWRIDPGQDQRRLDRLLRSLLAVERDDPRPNMTTWLGSGCLQVADGESQPDQGVWRSVTAHTR